MSNSRTLNIAGGWVACFGLTYWLFLPIKGDMFGHFLPIYIFLSLSIIGFILLFFLNKISGNVATKLVLLVVFSGVIFPICSYLYNGRLVFVNNAAEYNYQSVLWLMLDESSAYEVNLAIDAAKSGQNDEILTKLETLKTKPPGE